MGFEALFPFFARACGFFLFSPLFRWVAIPPFLRLGLALVTTLLLFPTLSSTTKVGPLALLTELAIGYLLGFLFSLLFESVALVGEVVGTMMGISVTELFNPLLNASSPLLSKALTLFVGALIFATDLHHVLLRAFFESYTLVPPDLFTTHTIERVMTGTSLLFTHALHYGAIPLLALSIVLMALAIASRLFPELPILWMGFPLQLLVGFGALIAAFSHFPRLTHRIVLEIKELAINLFG